MERRVDGAACGWSGVRMERRVDGAACGWSGVRMERRVDGEGYGLMRFASVSALRADSSRMMFATWWIFITVITAFYTANLTAFLTLASYDIPIQTIRNIPEHGMKWKALGKGALETLIRKGVDSNGTGSDVVDPFRPIRGDNIDDCFASEPQPSASTLDSVAAGTHVYIDDNDVLRYVVVSDYKTQRKRNSEAKSCRFLVSTQTIYTYNLGFAYPLGKQGIRDAFDPFIRRMMESGLVTQWGKKPFPAAPICGLPTGFQERSLQNTDLLTTYYLCLYGFGGAVLAFVIEKIVRKRCRRYLKKRQAKQQAKHQANHPPAPAISGVPTMRRIFVPRSGVPTPLGTRVPQPPNAIPILPPPYVPPPSIWDYGGPDKNLQPLAAQSAKSKLSIGGVRIFGDDPDNVVYSINGRPYVIVRDKDGFVRAMPAEKLKK
ncbi:unnamed protein product [Darwinula stevensoni]|uniref:Ionotropic glutamate receptor C-terminal domain-containing protein n=1 Tax=Darwinula stevensoni TaxID=69355 RepID=A0A7R9FTY8_9CRUS|nr:unnamed protein product [Darwinula stevensoni]CAG0905852.1 unnamed protein product [Darwinula stevensoni]